MARKSITFSQGYPRVLDPKRADRNCLDDSTLVPHENKIAVEKLKKLIVEAVRDAEKKSGREALAVPVNATEKELASFHQKEGKKLFDYWKKYVSDPAATAHQMHGKNYREVGVELFRSRALQKGRVLSMRLIPPDELIEQFGTLCICEELVDDAGNFYDPYKLLHFLM